MPRFMISYGRFLQEPNHVLSRCLDILGDAGSETPQRLREAAACVNPSLRHHQRDRQEEELLNPLQIQLHRGFEVAGQVRTSCELEVSRFANDLLIACPHTIDLGLVGDG